jgi:hypothetical protein
MADRPAGSDDRSMADEPNSSVHEVLDDGPRGVSPAELWSAVPRRRRRGMAAGVAVILAFTAAGAGVREAQQWLQERRLRDQVELRAAIDVQSWSSPLAGDRVDFFAIVHNTGSRPVRVTAIDIRYPRLHIRNRAAPRRPLAAGETLRVPLSVILDCTDRRTPRAGGLRGTVAASGANGRVRSVPASFDRSGLATDVADTLCSIRPNLRGAELSGPLGSGSGRGGFGEGARSPGRR